MSIRLSFQRNNAIVVVAFLLLFGKLAKADVVYVTSVYAAYSPNGTIERFDVNGNRSVFASDPALFQGLAFDKSGNLFAINGEAIRKYDSNGVMTTFANPHSGEIYCPAFDAAGNLYVSNYTNEKIIKFDPSGNSSIFAFGAYLYLAFDSSGNLYASGGSGITKFDPNGNETTFASFHWPDGLAFDKNGDLFVTNYNGGTIEKVDSSGGLVTFASGLAGPVGLAFDSLGNLYVTEEGAIVKYDSNGNEIIFASGVDGAGYIAIQPGLTPEPATLTLLAMGGLALLRRKRKTGFGG